MHGTLFDTSSAAAVMTFNLKNGQDVSSWNKRKSLLALIIRDAQPLFVGTQEGYGSQLTYICEQLPGYVPIGESRGSSAEDEFSAILIDSARVSVRESGTQWLSATPDVPGSAFPRDVFPRIVTWAICDLKGHDRSVMVANTHLTFEPAGVPAQLDVLLAQIKRLAPEHIDIILTGDFNVPMHSDPWHTLNGFGYVDALDFAKSHTGPLATFHDWHGMKSSESPPDTLEGRIDWIFYRPGDGTTLPQNCVLETIDTHDGNTYPSDHFPVVLRNHANAFETSH